VKKRKKKKNFFWFFAFSVVNSIHLEGIVSFVCLLNRPVSPDLVSIKSNVIGLALHVCWSSVLWVRAYSLHPSLVSRRSLGRIMSKS
jgi:hypothetical protein